MTIPKISLHNHTCYCDGVHTPEEIVLQAIELGVETLGFSGHEYTSFDTSWCMTPEKTEAYRKDILRLKEQYTNKLRILLGVERDFFSVQDSYPYDYVIGSVHYLIADDGAICQIDETPEQCKQDIDSHFGGDVYAWIERYYQTVAQVVDKTKCDIIGHFDLIQKFNEKNELFDPENVRYQSAVQTALDCLLKSNPIFEINTGAISRGYRTVPYPDRPVLTKLARSHARIVISSDSHRKEDILLGFEEAVRYAEACGITSFEKFSI